jgi:hypothetical protein
MDPLTPEDLQALAPKALRWRLGQYHPKHQLSHETFAALKARAEAEPDTWAVGSTDSARLRARLRALSWSGGPDEEQVDPDPDLCAFEHKRTGRLYIFLKQIDIRRAYEREDEDIKDAEFWFLLDSPGAPLIVPLWARVLERLSRGRWVPWTDRVMLRVADLAEDIRETMRHRPRDHADKGLTRFLRSLRRPEEGKG